MYIYIYIYIEREIYVMCASPIYFQRDLLHKREGVNHTQATAKSYSTFGEIYFIRDLLSTRDLYMPSALDPSLAVQFLRFQANRAHISVRRTVATSWKVELLARHHSLRGTRNTFGRYM